MTINDACSFIYANEKSDKYGLMLCSIRDINTDSNDESTSIITSKTALQRTSNFHSLQFNDPLRFNITICKSNGKFMDSNDERMYKKWLCKSERNWLQVDQPDLYDVWYNCIITNPTKDNIAKKTGGLTFTVECDWGGAWTHLYKKNYSTVNNYLQFNLKYNSDFDNDVLTPYLKIFIKTNCNIKINNLTTNKAFSISNCKKDETITFDNAMQVFSTTEPRLLLDNWNKKFLELVEGFNTIELIGDFTLDMEYRLPLRLGG